MAMGTETVLTVKEIHLDSALNSLRKAITVTRDDAERGSLTETAARVAYALRDSRNTLAAYRAAQADVVSASLEG